MLKTRLGLAIPTASMAIYIPVNQQDEYWEAAARAWIRHSVSKDGSALDSIAGFHQFFHDVYKNPNMEALDTGAAQRLIEATEDDLLDIVSGFIEFLFVYM